MGKFFNKKKAEKTPPEDFVLFKPDKDSSLDKTTAMDAINDSMLSDKDNSQHTVSIDTNEINSQLNKKKPFGKRKAVPGKAPLATAPNGNPIMPSANVPKKPYSTLGTTKRGLAPSIPPKPQVQAEVPKPQVQTEAPKPQVQTEAPKPQVQTEAPKPQVQATASIPVQTSTPVKPINPTKKQPKQKRQPNKFTGFFGKHRVLTICICAVLVAAIVTGGAFGIIVLSNPLFGYAQVATEKGSIMRTLDVQGTMLPGEKYEITSLVSGKIVASDFEVGDTVEEGDILYKIDDSEAQLAVDKAKNEVDRAKDESTGSAPTSFRIIASEAGTVGTLTVKEGSSVSPGMQIGTIRKADGSSAAITSYVSGNITALSVRSGQSLSPGQVIAVVSPGTQKNNSKYDKKSSEIDLQTAQQHLENFSITSPVSGVVIEKSTKVGDNVGITDTAKPMMVILDTSCLNFKFSLDEHKIRDIEEGQSVSVSTDTIPDTEFSGEVTSISSEGIAGEDGKPMYDVIATIDEPDDLRAGMNVSGTVVLKTKKDVIAIPEKALMESDGRNALVFVKITETENDDEDITDELSNELNYPWIKIPRGCKLVSVKYGLSDGSKVHIVSGLKLGDIVVYDPDSESNLVPSTLPDDEMDDMDFEDDFDLDLGIDEEDDTDEELQRAIQKQLSHLETTL